MNNFESKIKPALLDKHGAMTDEGVAVFRRKWEVSLTLEATPLIPTDEEVSITSDIAKPAFSPRPWGMSSFLLDEMALWSSWRAFPNEAPHRVASAWIGRDPRRESTHSSSIHPFSSSITPYQLRIPRIRLDEVEVLMNIITAQNRSIPPLLFRLLGLCLGFRFGCLWDKVGVPAGNFYVETRLVSPEQ